MTNDELTAEIARSLLDYSKETGELFWKVGRAGASKGSKAASLDKTTGYMRITILGKKYYAHRIAWLIVNGQFPSNQIDHINGCRHDNRLSNIRSVSSSENLCLRRTWNKTGFKGVYEANPIKGKTKKYMARISINKKMVYLGSFDTKEKASAAVKVKAKNLYHLIDGGCYD